MQAELRKQLRSEAESNLLDSIRAKEALRQSALDVVLDMADLLARAFRGGHRLFLFGNGGSAADAQHLAAEFVNRFQMERIALPALALTPDSSVLTSIGNDRAFEDIFLRQLQALAQPGDVALGISTSGTSPNVLKALRWARENGVHTLGLAGAERTEMGVCCDLLVRVPSPLTPRIQECHITVGHILCGLVETILFGQEEASHE
jgi:D-sedoheptulose 7-phosphate isomerase